MSKMSDSTLLSDDDIEESYTSELKFRKFKLIWMIKDIEFIFNNMKAIESPRFPSKKSEKVKWYLRLETTKLKDGNKETFKMFLKNTDNSERYLGVKIYFFNSFKEIKHFYADFQNFNLGLVWSKTGEELYKILTNKDESLLKNLTITCEITFFDCGRNVINEPMAVPLNSEGILKQIECFLDDQGFKDVKFIVEEKEFSAHKTILALRSPVFAAMFKSKMSEELSSVVEIKDISSTIFQSMLRFIYTDQVQDLKESALELFYAAEKYQLEKLKKLCINSLYNNMSTKTVVKIFELADTFSVPKLKTKAGEYLVSCLKAIEESKEYADLLETRPDLAAEIIKLQKEIDNDVETYEDLFHEMKYELL